MEKPDWQITVLCVIRQSRTLRGLCKEIHNVICVKNKATVTSTQRKKNQKNIIVLMAVPSTENRGYLHCCFWQALKLLENEMCQFGRVNTGCMLLFFFIWIGLQATIKVCEQRYYTVNQQNTTGCASRTVALAVPLFLWMRLLLYIGKTFKRATAYNVQYYFSHCVCWQQLHPLQFMATVFTTHITIICGL